MRGRRPPGRAAGAGPHRPARRRRLAPGAWRALTTEEVRALFGTADRPSDPAVDSAAVPSSGPSEGPRPSTSTTRDHIADRVEAIRAGRCSIATGCGPTTLVSLLFTATADMRATFPATAARARIPGLADVPLMTWPELDVVGALPRCIRVMAHVDTDAAPGRGAATCSSRVRPALRPDLAERR